MGEYASKYKHRLTTHPGQFTQLGSPKPDVVRRAILDLEYHAQMLDLMGLPSDSVMIIHMGGAFGDRKATLQRFAENFRRLSKSAQARLVLENDEVVWSVEELLPTCQQLQIPLVLDWHHDRLRPSSQPIAFYLEDIKATWTMRGIKQKQHYSESRTDGSHPRAHSDRVVFMPPCEPDVDLMIEAKDKEQAVLDLYHRFGFYKIDAAESQRITERIVTEHTQTLNESIVKAQENGDKVTIRRTASSNGKGRTQLKEGRTQLKDPSVSKRSKKRTAEVVTETIPTTDASLVDTTVRLTRQAKRRNQ